MAAKEYAPMSKENEPWYPQRLLGDVVTTPNQRQWTIIGTVWEWQEGIGPELSYLLRGVESGDEQKAHWRLVQGAKAAKGETP